MLVAPACPRATWFVQLLQLLVETPRTLPAKRTLLRQPRSRVFHQNTQVLMIHVWILSKRRCERETFLSSLPKASLAQSEGLQALCMMPSGTSSLLGVMNGRLIHSVPLSFWSIKEGGVSPSTLEGYRTAISGTIRHITGLDLAQDPAISQL